MSIKHPFARLVTSLLLTAAVSLSASKCKAPEPGSSGMSKEGVCEITKVQLPEPYTAPGAEEPWIQASITIACNPAPATSRTVLGLERHNPESGRWIRLWTGQPETNIPDREGRTFAVVYPWCEEGAWRLWGSISGQTEGGSPYRVNAPTHQSYVTC